MKLRTLFMATLLLGATATAQQPLPQTDVLGYLDQAIDWQRTAAGVEPTGNNAREIIFRDMLRQQAVTVVKRSFDFARKEAESEPELTNADTEVKEGQEPTPQQKLVMLSRDNADTIVQLRSRLTTARGALRQSLSDQLQLQLARQEVLNTAMDNITAISSKATTSLGTKIDNLERSMPELDGTVDATKTNSTKTTASKTKITSVMSLSSAIFDITRKSQELENLLTKTTELRNKGREIMATMRTALEQEIGPHGPTPEGQEAQAAQPTIQERIINYKRISAAIMPLAQATLFAESSRQAIKDWQEVLDQQRQALLRQLGMMLAILAATLAVPLVISHIAHRGIERYTGDPKRQRQLNVARRIITGVVIVFILLLNFISDFSSFATFAGFLTAGLAVALQSVLLSLVAHFFFYGRYGVRAGDRVHVAGVTGDIIQIGMVRFHLRELREGESGMEPTGKVVAFPNAILFQNIAFYKYVG